MVSNVTQKSHTNSGYRLSVPPPLLCLHTPSLQPFLSSLSFFYTRLEWLPLPASESIIVFVQQPLREGLNSTFFSALFSGTASKRPLFIANMESCCTHRAQFRGASISSAFVFLVALVEPGMHWKLELRCIYAQSRRSSFYHQHLFFSLHPIHHLFSIVCSARLSFYKPVVVFPLRASLLCKIYSQFMVTLLNALNYTNVT